MEETTRLVRLISDWAAFHTFDDDAHYPLISPSDVVIDDLAFRLQAAGYPYEVDKLSKEKWKQIPDCKGKERRLRRANPDIVNSLVEGWVESGAKIPGDVTYQQVIDWIEAQGGNPKPLIKLLSLLQRKSPW